MKSRRPVLIEERHRQSVYQAMNYIEANLGEKLSLHTLAELTAYSPFHFHRLFKAVVGENPNDYVKRLRLERARVRVLLFPEESLSEIALSCGFASSGDFSRSFKGYYGQTASELREQGAEQYRKICETERKRIEGYCETIYYNGVDAEGRPRVEARQTLKVAIRQLPSCRVVYERCLGRGGSLNPQEEVRLAFERVAARSVSHRDAVFQSMNIGVPHRFPLVVGSQYWSYDACRTVPGTADEPAGPGSRRLEGGRYAILQVARRDGWADALMASFFYEWLPTSGYVLDDRRPLLERFRYADVGHAPEMECCIPVTIRG